MWRTLLRRPAPNAAGQPDLEMAGTLAARLDSAAQRRLGRSLAVLHVAAGGCGGCSIEFAALRGAAYDLERFGLSIVSDPRHADVLMVTGPLTRAMRPELQAAWAAMPGPKWLIAAGGCAIDGGPFAGSYAVVGGIDRALPVDLGISGCPPNPASLLTALLTLIEANS